jgi:hypothetical protein
LNALLPAIIFAVAIEAAVIVLIIIKIRQIQKD